MEASVRKTMDVGGITVKLANPFETKTPWVGGEVAARQLRAAWLKMSDEDMPMNPRLVGKPGVGKTTLAVSVAQSMGLPVYIMQGTSDTRPEDLIITPVITEGKQIAYIASPLVTAMLVGGVCVLDEGNRMSEKSWASLAALLDHRRYVDSVIAGVRVEAHANFRFVTTMNDDASVYDLPEYIYSRLNPQIYIDFADPQSESRIIKMAVPFVEADVLNMLVSFLATAHALDQAYSVRDGIQIARYASKVRSLDSSMGVPQALTEAIVAVLGEAALRFVPSDGGGGPRKPLRPVNK